MISKTRRYIKYVMISYLLVCRNKAFVSEGDKIPIKYSRVSHIKFQYTIQQHFRVNEFEPKISLEHKLCKLNLRKIIEMLFVEHYM